ncbi:MAG: hypothetical protein JSW70_06020 [Syntrophobacterales bacterium]|nr:MAG: hypothetical protein JSW70_06020 [Syntrophobacterales bacterium]
MNIKRFIIASIAVFICFQVLNFIIHGVILDSTYESLKDVWRPDMMSKMWIMYITSLILSFLFVYIFTKGYEARGIAEGVRYGLLIGLLMNIPGMFNQYVIYPIPFYLALQWFIYGTIEFIACGIVAALIYKPKTSS